MATEATAVDSGISVSHTPSGAAVVPGEVVPLGSMVGVASKDIAVGVPGSLQIAGKYDVPCASADVIAVGDDLYWDDSASQFTKTATNNTYGGKAGTAAGNGVTTCHILLNI